MECMVPHESIHWILGNVAEFLIICSPNWVFYFQVLRRVYSLLGDPWDLRLRFLGFLNFWRRRRKFLKIYKTPRCTWSYEKTKDRFEESTSKNPKVHLKAPLERSCSDPGVRLDAPGARLNRPASLLERAVTPRDRYRSAQKAPFTFKYAH